MTLLNLQIFLQHLNNEKFLTIWLEISLLLLWYFWSKRAFKVQTHMHEGHVVVGQKIQRNRSQQKDTHKISHMNSIRFPYMFFFLDFLFMIWRCFRRYSIFQSNPMSHVHSSSTSSNPHHETNCMISRSLSLVISDCIAWNVFWYTSG